MYLLAYENGEYGFERSVDLQNFKKTGMAIVHLQIKTQNAYAYSLSELYSVNGEFVDSCFVTGKWENVNFETEIFVCNGKKLSIWNITGAENDVISIRDIIFFPPDDHDLFNGGILYQLPTRHHTQMMGYFYLTPSKEVFAIDGGNPCDQDTVIDTIKELGGVVHHWFITHYHDDHVGAIIEAAKDPSITIKNIYFDFPGQEILAERGDADSVYVKKLIDAIPANTVIHTPKKGNVYEFYDLKVTVLNDACFDEGPNFANDSSICYKFDTGKTKILFPGDLARKCNDYLKDKWFATQIKDCGIVQMTHHGNNGATKAFYDAIDMERCLWPTPLWLWNNDGGQGKNTFKFTTLETREWMREKNIKKHYLSIDGKTVKIL